jgi:hypothetical protein
MVGAASLHDPGSRCNVDSAESRPVVSAVDDRSGNGDASDQPLTLLRDRDGTSPLVDLEPEEITGGSDTVDQRPGAAGISPLSGDIV